MRRSSVLVLAACLLVAALGIVVPGVRAGRARAATATFDRNLVMSNQVFDASRTMTTAQIQALLDRYPNSCLRTYSAAVPTGYSSYTTTKGSAAAVIQASAALWGVNPQVLLATLEKEQGIVTGGAGCASWRYWSAMGYNCPDGGGSYNYPNLGIYGTCVKRESDAGFSAQVNHGAWQLVFNRQRAEGNLNWNNSSSIPNYGYNTTGWRQAYAGAPSIYYDGWATVAGTAVFMTNGATASLYTYTPYVSANQAFWNLFTNWFGSTISLTTPPPTTTTTTLPLPTSGPEYNFVDSVHRVFFGRRATAGEETLWLTYFRNGGSRSGFVNWAAASPDAAQHLVTTAYRKTLLRAPDPGGLTSWTKSVGITGRDDSLYAGLAGSTEYYRTRADSDDLLFLSAIYLDLLGRNVDKSGLTTWRARLSDHTMTRTQVAMAVMQSSEYARRTVAGTYALVLGRWPDPAGSTYWTSVYLRTHRANDVGAALAASSEGYSYLSSLG